MLFRKKIYQLFSVWIVACSLLAIASTENSIKSDTDSTEAISEQSLKGAPTLAPIRIDVSKTPERSTKEALKPTSKMRTETLYLTHLLEELHFQGHPISKLNFEEFLKNYLDNLDYNRLFLLKSDEEGFYKRFAPSLDLLLRGGSLMPAFEIFSVYAQRISTRVQWVINYIKTEKIDFTTKGKIAPDRHEAPRFSNDKEADDFWKKRIKYELLNEVMSSEDNDNTEETQNDSHLDKKESPTSEKAPNKKELVDHQTKNIDKNKLFSQKLEKAKENLIKRYERMLKMLDEIEATEIQESYLNSLTHMYDPHTTFMCADTMEDFANNLHNSLVGIGVALTQEDGYCVIKEIFTGSPADKSNMLRNGDKILAVAQGTDGQPCDIVGMKLKHILKLIRGKKNTVVQLTIQPGRGDPSKRKTVTLVRDEIKLTSNLAKAQVYEVPCGKDIVPIGVIDLPSFYGSDPNSDIQNTSTTDMEELINKLKAQKIKAIILDLRHNGGGLLNEAISVSGLFVPTGPIVQVKTIKGRTLEHLDKDPSIAWKGPLIVLVSRYSASASEIVAGALKNHKRALIVGDPSTHGKGTVQAIIEMDRFSLIPKLKQNLGAAKITIQKFYLPDGSSTQLKGVPSDIEFPSFNTFLPIGESDLPNALTWDAISAYPWDYKSSCSYYESPITDKITLSLKEKSLKRQASLPEFKFLQERIQHFKTKQDEKEVSINLEEREKQKKEDNLYKEKTEKHFRELAKANYLVKNILLDVSLKNSPEQKESVTSSMEKHFINNPDLDIEQNNDNDDEKSKEDNTPIDRNNPKKSNKSKESELPDFDIYLRESLRIASDWIDL
ncbi:MAG: hypothetical protein A2007_05840, partial [Verrucomicrobia bacterium GWC2_42_7]